LRHSDLCVGEPSTTVHGHVAATYGWRGWGAANKRRRFEFHFGQRLSFLPTWCQLWMVPYSGRDDLVRTALPEWTSMRSERLHTSRRQEFVYSCDRLSGRPLCSI